MHTLADQCLWSYPRLTLFVIQLLNWLLTTIKLINSLLTVATYQSPEIDLYMMTIFSILIGKILTHRKMISSEYFHFKAVVCYHAILCIRSSPHKTLETSHQPLFRKALRSRPAAAQSEVVFWRTPSFEKLYSCQMLWELPSVLLFPSFPGGYWTSDRRLPACTVSEALTYLLDITTPPSQQLLKKLSQLVTAEGDKQRLEVLCQVGVTATFVLKVLGTGPSGALCCVAEA